MSAASQAKRQNSDADSEDSDDAAALERISGRSKRTYASNGISSSYEPAAKRRRLQITESGVATRGSSAGDNKVCASCGATSTSQWRRGVDGFLCNSCGIKLANQRTRRRSTPISARTQKTPSFFGRRVLFPKNAGLAADIPDLTFNFSFSHVVSQIFFAMIYRLSVPAPRSADISFRPFSAATPAFSLPARREKRFVVENKTSGVHYIKFRWFWPADHVWRLSSK